LGGLGEASTSAVRLLADNEGMIGLLVSSIRDEFLTRYLKVVQSEGHDSVAIVTLQQLIWITINPSYHDRHRPIIVVVECWTIGSMLSRLLWEVPRGDPPPYNGVRWELTRRRNLVGHLLGELLCPRKRFVEHGIFESVNRFLPHLPVDIHKDRERSISKDLDFNTLVVASPLKLDTARGSWAGRRRRSLAACIRQKTKRGLYCDRLDWARGI
jgi:hypothetical protein